MAGRKRAEPKVIRPDDIDPHHRWDRPLQSPGHTQVDFEERVEFPAAARLPPRPHARGARQFRAGRAAVLRPAQHQLHARAPSSANGRATSSRVIRCSPATATRISGISAPRRSTTGCMRRGSPTTTVARGSSACAARSARDLELFRSAAREIKAILGRRGRCRSAARPRRRRAADAVRAAEARNRRARRPADAARGARGQEHRRADPAQHGGGDGRRRLPGHRRGAEARRQGKSEIVALATSRLYGMGSDCVEAINAISGERCSPHPHNFTDR